ncbi:hypothetical protein [Sphingobacterium cellulitidis]|uniref:Peptidase S74 domain-containing protein n=1 Tax=Sphingobacterium cellulitidis TaxID=1768011 RepID=A0A8H9FY36_9SPHI|nr:hypothetical protein [Sphingobacterium soli]MBA8986156.1 hypothetical protein [Sphingobacterium soli]GGE18056.1 hypothetical protein GCM10011516_14620 [Sphingobacterium soli]
MRTNTKYQKIILSFLPIIFGTIFTSKAQNLFPTTKNSYITIDGGGINQLAPVTTGGWARGTTYFNSDGTKGFFSLGMLGSVGNPSRFYLAFAENSPWASELGLHILPNGNIGVGTVSPVARLTVNGNILAKEIKIKTDITVPDYVFEQDYEKMSLSEIEEFVAKHKHLPDIPSAKSIERDGLEVAEMNLLLLKKIEELTLHLIENEKTIKQLKKDFVNFKTNK